MEYIDCFRASHRIDSGSPQVPKALLRFPPPMFIAFLLLLFQIKSISSLSPEPLQSHPTTINGVPMGPPKEGLGCLHLGLSMLRSSGKQSVHMLPVWIRDCTESRLGLFCEGCDFFHFKKSVAERLIHCLLGPVLICPSLSEWYLQSIQDIYHVQWAGIWFSLLLPTGVKGDISRGPRGLRRNGCSQGGEVPNDGSADECS